MTTARPRASAAPARAGDRTGNSPAPVVVGVDGSLDSIVALGWAARQAHATGARMLVVVHAWQPPLARSALPGSRVRTREEAARDAHADVESALRHTFGPQPVDLTIDVEVLEGEPGPLLVSAAREASLLVVGTRGHGALARLLLGSVSTYCAQHATCTVVIVPTPSAAAAERLYPVAAPRAHVDRVPIPVQSRARGEDAGVRTVPDMDMEGARGRGTHDE